MSELVSPRPVVAKAKPLQPIVAGPPAKQVRSWSKLTIASVLLACMAGVCAISYFVLIKASLRLDESQSLWQTSHSIGDTLRVVAQDVHVPLYHIILHFWQLYFGHDVMTVRLLSLIFFLITIPLVYKLARTILSTGWALFTTVIFSFMPFMDWYANEARMYTMLVLFATLSQIYFIGIMQNKKRAWRKFGIVGMVGAYSHYFFSFNVAAQGLFFLANRKRFAKGSFKRFVIIGILIGLSLSPWLFYFHALGSGQNTSPLLARPSTVDFFNVFSQFIFGFQDNYINTVLLSSWPLLVLLAFFAVKRGQKVSLELAYLISAGLVPVLLAYLLSFIVSPFFLSRYMISCVAPLIIVIVWFISNYGKRMARLAAALLIVATALGSVQQAHSAATPVKEDYQAVAETITQKAQAQDTVVLSAPFTVYPFEYYYNGVAQIQTLPIWNRQAAGAIPAFNAKTLPQEVNQLSSHHHYIYLVLSQNQGYENTIKQYFLHHYPQVSKTTFSPDLTLYVFQVGYFEVPPLGSSQTIIKTVVAAPAATTTTTAKTSGVATGNSR